MIRFVNYILNLRNKNSDKQNMSFLKALWSLTAGSKRVSHVSTTNESTKRGQPRTHRCRHQNRIYYCEVSRENAAQIFFINNSFLLNKWGNVSCHQGSSL